MNQYGGLIEKAGRELNILKEENENSELWKTRVVYSIMGKMALASLYDVLENDQPVSIIHFKRRIQKIMQAYLELYPEIKQVMQASMDEFEEEIYTIYLKCGYLYHTPNRILPSAEKRVGLSNVEIIRGSALNEKTFMSGLGTFFNKKCEKDFEGLFELFNIENISLLKKGEGLIKKALWRGLQSELSKEYLRIEPPFSRGYWKETPDKNGEISLLRLGDKSNYIYYLYKYEDEALMVSELPAWMVEGIKYRNISNSILVVNRSLPPLKIEKRKYTVLIKQEYLLPPEVFFFVKLYSWPAKFYSVPSDFERVMSKDIYEVLNGILDIIGIEVSE